MSLTWSGHPFGPRRRMVVGSARRSTRCPHCIRSFVVIIAQRTKGDRESSVRCIHTCFISFISLEGLRLFLKYPTPLFLSARLEAVIHTGIR